MNEKTNKPKEKKSRAFAHSVSVGQAKGNSIDNGAVLQQSPKFNALINKINNPVRGNVKPLQLGKKYDALEKKAGTPAQVTENEIKEATKEHIGELFVTNQYKDSDGNPVTAPNNFIFGADYGAAPDMLLLPTVKDVCKDIQNGVFKIAIGHEMGHYVRTIGNNNERDSFPAIEGVIDNIDWAALTQQYQGQNYNMDSWKEEIRADLKSIKLHYDKEGTVPGDAKITEYGKMLGGVVDNEHPPAVIRTKAIRTYVRDINPSCCCYITNACIKSRGLSDNCKELKTLRKFRDTYLVRRNNGEELIQIYYRNSPIIVEAIDKSTNPKEIYDELYNVIKSCVEAIEKGNNEYAYTTYCNMVIDLKQKFIPEDVLLDENDKKITKTVEQIIA